VVSFITGSSHSPETFVKGMNYYLPGDIAVRTAHRVRDSFHVRHQAIDREYKYYILNNQVRSPLGRNYSLLVNGQLDVDAMNQASQALVGEHDFASFTNRNGAELKSTVRRVSRAEVGREGEFIVFTMVANAFLTHQIRNTVGTLIKVGLGKMNRVQFCAIMEAARPGLAGPMALAHGLCLVAINYPRLPEEV
jgi:tRNA pseudouridine38-40 synthase